MTKIYQVSFADHESCVFTLTISFIIAIIVVSFMLGSHTHIPETNHAPGGYSVAAILSLLFMVPLCLACFGSFVLLR